MNALPAPGDYQAKLTEPPLLFYSMQGALLVRLSCELLNSDPPGFRCESIVTIAKSDGEIMQKNVETLKTLFGEWGPNNDDPFAMTQNPRAMEAVFELGKCQHEEYNGQVRFKGGFLNVIGANRGPAEADRAAVLAQFGARFRALAGGSNMKKPAQTGLTNKPAPAQEKVQGVQGSLFKKPMPKVPPPPPPPTPAQDPADNFPPTPPNEEECWAALCEVGAGRDEQELAMIWRRLTLQRPSTPEAWGALKATIEAGNI